MNENIGAKGGKNDRKRTLIITQRAKKKLEEAEEKEERKKKSIKRIDIETLIKIIPILILGNTLEVLSPSKKKEEEKKEQLQDKESTIKEKKEKQEVIETLSVDKKVGDNKKTSEQLSIKNIQEEERKISEQRKDYDKNLRELVEEKENIEKKKQEIEKIEDLEVLEEQKRKEEEIKEKKEEKQSYTVDENKNLENRTKEHTPGIIVTPTSKLYKEKTKYTLKKAVPIIMSAPLLITGAFINEKKKTDNKNIENKKVEDKINRLTNVKLIETYEDELNNIRYDLKKLIFDYNHLVDEEEDIYTSEQIKDLINKLNSIIAKIEELKRKLDLDNISRYDDEYIKNTVNEYMDILGKGIVIDALKDSELYIALSKKIEEIDAKKDYFKEHVTRKEEDILYDEKEMDIIKDDYTNLKKFSTELEKFQTEQERLFLDLQEKIASSERIEERVETTITILNKQSKRLLQLLAVSMMVPTLPGAKEVVAGTLAYMYFFRKSLKPKIQKNYKRYQKIKVEDFSIDIQNSLNSLNNMISTIHKSSISLDEMIKNFKEDYKDYIDNSKECRELLENLKQMQENLREKEFDLNKIKNEQQKNLELNNDKVKVLRREKLVSNENDIIL